MTNQSTKKEWRDTERVAMNIVYQICDLLGTDVGLRQTHNDTMINFTKKLLDHSVTIAVEEFGKKVEEEVIGEIETPNYKVLWIANKSVCRNQLRRKQRQSLKLLIKTI